VETTPTSDAIGRGFSDPVLASQTVFRQCLGALSEPGAIVAVESDAAVPAGLCAAANALALALLDQDTRLWLSPAVSGAVAGHLRFHTGCVLVADPALASFAVIGHPRELPPLEAFSAGSDEHPERSATLILQVEGLSSDGAWRLSGPGIRDGRTLAAGGLGREFLDEWANNRSKFPRGVDVFLASGNCLCGLPRTTRIEG
jgi:alpha-D-ribose 1-methylphosphonate 5-triphosphate synthase subunit PhnH